MNREMRLAILVAVLIALGAVGVDVGARALGAVLLVLAATLSGAYIGLVVRPARIPRESLLMIRLGGGLREYASVSPLDHVLGRGFPTLYHVRSALEAAARDHLIKGVIVELAGLEVGYATAQELHDLLASVRDAGKRVIAVVAGDSLKPKEYLVACGAGEVAANPDAGVMMLGVAAGSLFVKQALEKLEIQAQTLQWKEYKGAGEMFGRERMSPALRESIEALVGDWEQMLVDNVARARRLKPARARELLNSGFMSARAACECGLLDRVGYAEDFRAEFSPEGDERKTVGLARYLRRVDYMRDIGKRARLALVYGLGPVIAGEAPQTGEFLSGEETARALERAAADRRVRAIVFRVNSPGGSAVGSDLVWRAVREARGRGKPVVVSMGDVAGSGGYYVAMGADAIVAQPSTVTGSIGVIYTKFNLGSLLGRLGINLDFAKSGEVSDALSWSRAMNEAELEQLNRMVGELYGNFTAKVADSRGLAPGRTEELARGRVWSGLAAQAQGLIDSLGGLTRAIELAREKAGLEAGEPHELALYPPSRRWMGVKLGLAPDGGLGWSMRLLARALGVPEQWAPATIELLTNGCALLLMPFFG